MKQKYTKNKATVSILGDYVIVGTVKTEHWVDTRFELYQTSISQVLPNLIIIDLTDWLVVIM